MPIEVARGLCLGDGSPFALCGCSAEARAVFLGLPCPLVPLPTLADAAQVDQIAHQGFLRKESMETTLASAGASAFSCAGFDAGLPPSLGTASFF